MKRVTLWIALAIAMAPALHRPAHSLDVRAVNQEVARLQAELRDIENKIKNLKSVVEEKARAINHWFAIDEQAKRSYAAAQDRSKRWLEEGPPSMLGLGPPSIPPLESLADRAMELNPFFPAGGGGEKIRNHAALLSYATFLEKSLPMGAEKEIESLQALHRDKIAELLRLQWQMVADGIGEDPILGSWNLVLADKGSVVTVRKAPDGRKYLGVIDVSTLEHFPQGAVLFSVIIDPNKPYSYTGVQYGYTRGVRDAREDEPLRIDVHGDTVLYANRQQRLAWQRFGQKP